jgi:hypothetical protein
MHTSGSTIGTENSDVNGIAKGTFNVKLAPLAFEEVPVESLLGRLSIGKTFEGDLVGTSLGQMLTAGDNRTGSGVYVAVERVTGSLNGKSGTFALHHTGIMDQGKPSLEIRVVPGSGTGELAGISGSLKIEINDKVHYYELDYATPA